MKFKRLLLLFLFPSLIFAQLGRDELERIIPKDLVKDSNRKTDILVTLEEEAKISPILVHYRLKYYREVIIERNYDKGKNGFEYINALKNQIAIARNKWIEYQRNILFDKISDSNVISKVDNYLNHLMLDVASAPNTKINKQENNKLDYYYCYYYSKGDIGIYDLSKNYKDIRENYEKKLLQQIEQYGDKLEKGVNINKEEFFDLVENNIFFIVSNSSFDLASIISNCFRSDFYITNLDRFFVGSSYSIVISNKTFTNKINLKYKGVEANIGKTKYFPTATFEVGSRFMFKDEIKILSYLDITFNYTKYNVDVMKYSLFRKVLSKNSDYKLEKIIHFHDMKISNSKVEGYGLKLSSPAFVVTPKISLDLGLFINYLKSSFNTNYKYTYIMQKTSRSSEGFIRIENIDYKKDVSEMNSKSKSEINISPQLSCQFRQLLRHIDLLIGYDINNIIMSCRLSF